jgi:hypothetical protein
LTFSGANNSSSSWISEEQVTRSTLDFIRACQ